MSSSSSSLAARLERFYQHYAPEKLANIPKLCETYKGMETKLFDELVKRYGPEPPSAASSGAEPGGASSPSFSSPRAPSSPQSAAQSDTAAVRLRLQQYYERHAPDKVGNIDTVLNHYKGNHDQMFRDLAAKYEKGPAALSPSSPPADKTAAPAAPSPSAASAPASPSADVYRARVKRFYERYAPEKLGNIDAVLQHYAGKEDAMMKELVAKYGPEPVASTEAQLPAQNLSLAYRQRLTRFLAKYSPDKASQADALLLKYAGKEEELFKGLVAKFGPEPPEQDNTPASTATSAPATTSSTPQATPYQRRVEQILLKYAPDKVSSAPSMLQKYLGRENELIQALVTKFGPEPPSSSSLSTSTAAEPGTRGGDGGPTDSMSPEARLTRFMTHYAPERLNQVPVMLQKYQGREAEMFHALTSKFGPEPPVSPSGQAQPSSSIPEPKSFEDMYRCWIGAKAFDALLQRYHLLFTSDDASLRERRCLLALCLECMESLAALSNEEEVDAAAVVGLRQFNVLRALVEGAVTAPASRGGSSDAAASESRSSRPDAAAVALRSAPSFVDTQLVVETVHLAKKICALATETAVAVEETSAAAEQQGNELLRLEQEDKERVVRLARERAARRCAVISRAVEMIGEVESEMRLELWRVQELEARGRLLWFQDRRRELQLLVKPTSLSVLERKFERWKELVKEQQDVVFHVEHARHSHYHSPRHVELDSGYNNAAAAAAAGGAKMSVASPNQVGSPSTTLGGTDHHRHASGESRDKRWALPYGGEQRRTADRDGGPATPQGTPRSVGWASGSGRTPRGSSPALRGATPTRRLHRDVTRSPRSLLRNEENSANSMPYWGQYTPQRALHQHPSKAAVTPSTTVPRRSKIPTTVPEPFQLSSSSKKRAGVGAHQGEH